MLAVRRRPEDCSYLPLLGTAGGATWWQVSESKWACPRGTGPGFRRECRATAGPRATVRRFRRYETGCMILTWAATSCDLRAATRNGEHTFGDARARVCEGYPETWIAIAINSCLTRVCCLRETRVSHCIRSTNMQRTFLFMQLYRKIVMLKYLKI